jgi:hypothetical protein
MHFHNAFDHAVRGVTVAVASALGFTGSLNLVATSIPGAEELQLVQYLEKGGGWAVLLVVLWVYRRDYKRLSEGETERVNQLIDLHEKSAKATQEVAVALTRNTEVLRSIAAQRQGHHYEGDHVN